MEKNMQKESKLRFVITTLIIFFLISSVISFFIYGSEEISGNVALIKIRGVISTDKEDSFSRTTTSSIEVIKLIEKAEESPNIKAILFDINSPGGSPVGSKEIGDAIKRAKKPTFSLIHEIGASGAYWIASSTDYIIANDLSITGSIGVISSYIEFEGLLKKYNMTYQRMVGGEYKDIGDPLRKLSDEERDILQKKIDKIHNYFIGIVAKNRNMSFEKAEELSTGEFYLGSEALELGLVDELGDSETAKEAIKQKLNITEVDFIEYSTPKSFFDVLSGVFSDNSFLVGKGIGSAITGQSDINKPLINT